MAIAAYTIQLVEYERGWGSRVDDTVYFLEKEEAVKWARYYNQKYNSNKDVPDWYMIAVEDVSLVEITVAQETALKKADGKMYWSQLRNIK